MILEGATFLLGVCMKLSKIMHQFCKETMTIAETVSVK